MTKLHLAGAAALLVASGSPGVTADTPAVSAKRFVDRLYELAGPVVPESQMYTPELARLIARAQVVADKTEDMDLVGNILCDCQDITEFKVRTAVVSATPAAASVRVLLTGGVDGPRRFLLKLARTPAGWRLADAVAEPGGSYAANLRANIKGQ